MSDTLSELTPIEFRVTNLDWKKLAVLASCVNDAPFRGHATGTVISRPAAIEQFEGAHHYWDVTIQLGHANECGPACPRTDFSKFTAEEFEAK